MFCPQCKAPHQMKTYETEQLTLNRCPRCAGFWFSEAQLLELNQSLAPDLKWLDLDFWKARAQFRVRQDPLWCPQCRDIQLTNVHDTVSDTSAATCSVCQGIWLEAGQLDGLLNAISEEAETISSSDYIKKSLHFIKDLAAEHDHASVENWRELKSLLRLLKYRLYAEHPKLVSLLIGSQKSLPL